MFLDPGDLQLGFVEETAVSELDLPCRPSCCELRLVVEHLACPVNSGVNDAEVTHDPVGVEQQPEAACLVSDAEREPDRQLRRWQCMGASERLVDLFDRGAHLHRRPVGVQAVRDPPVGSTDTEGTEYSLLNPSTRRPIEM
jgi:hypothetical protein